MRKVFMVLVFMALFLFPLEAADYDTADFDSDFRNAARMVPSGAEAAKGTDLLVRDTAGVLHREHLAILAELAKLRKEIADLKKDVKSIKGQVE